VTTPSAPAPITVFLAEDMHMVRGALRALLDLEPDIDVVGETARGDDVLDGVRRLHPAVAVIDIDLPGIDGLAATQLLRRHAPDCRVLILTALGRPGMLRRALAAQVDGFLPKDARPDRLADAIRQIAAGRRVIDSELALAAWERGGCPLTERELDVLTAAARGDDVDDIATTLFLSPGTVRNYLTSAVTKLDARNRLDAVRIASDAGWL
jgi:two-component system, NarL family, response regulator DesR